MASFPEFEFSHIGLHAFDVERMAQFYKDVFGFIETDRGTVHGGTPVVFLSRNPRDHHQVVIAGGRTAPTDALLLNQISIRVESLADLREVHEAIQQQDGASDIRPITHGNAYSVYFRDPEGNKLEIFTDSPWYVEQPVIEPLDLAKSDEEILAETEASLKDKPGFKPFSEWKDDIRRRLDAKD